MSAFEVPQSKWDGYVLPQGFHVGVTREGFDAAALDEAYRALVDNGHEVQDGVFAQTSVGGYGELAVDRHLSEKAEAKLRTLGFTGLSTLEL